jgi:hypothetical protein
LTPIITKRYGLKRCVWHPVSSHASHRLISLVQCDIATLLLLLSAWVRYAGTSRSLSKNGAYALIIIGQVGETIPEIFPPAFVSYFRQALSAVSQPVYQILAPKYSERWFDLNGRTTATMIISIGMNSYSQHRISAVDTTSFQRILLEVPWVSCYHPSALIHASRCVHIQSIHRGENVDVARNF